MSEMDFTGAAGEGRRGVSFFLKPDCTNFASLLCANVQNLFRGKQIMQTLGRPFPQGPCSRSLALPKENAT